ncbi:MAG TPA: hypothetical protein PLP83_10500 [Candidatus Aminicenantes bacterium]|nr:hypothetical protein [Candidatus Aminicenantes bacterium]
MKTRKKGAAATALMLSSLRSVLILAPELSASPPGQQVESVNGVRFYEYGIREIQ